MKKILSLMALLLLTVTTAWAEDVVIYWANGTSAANEITVNGATLQISGNLEKTWSNGNGDITLNEVAYKTIKNSNGAQNTVTLPDGKKATKVVFHAVSNATSEAKLTEFNGESCEHVVTSLKDYSNPTVIEKTFDTSVSSFTFTFSSKQVCFLMVITYEEEAPTKTVYFDNSKSNWENVYAYAWYNDGTDHPVSAEWPGDAITVGESGMYEWTTTGDPTYILFHNNSGTQTADLGFEDGATYNKDGRVFTVTFKTNCDWTKAYAYTWRETDGTKQLGDWPGTKMTPANEDGTWTITFGAVNAPEYIIFNNNADDQTGDLTFEDGKAYEYMMNEYTATFTTDANWETVKAYVWTGEGENEYLGEWPGTALTANEGVYTVTIKTWGDAPEKIIFNDGGSSQTSQDGWTFVNDKAYAYIINPLFAIKAGVTYTYGQTVYVADADKDVVATLTFGNKGENGNNFNETTDEPDKIEGYASFSARTNGGNGENGNKSGGTTYTIKPLFDGKVSIAVKLGANKVFYIKENGTALDGYNGITKSDTYYGTFDFDVTAGKEYKFYCDGSKLDFYGFNFTGYTKSEPNFKVAGSMTDWNKLYVYADSYTFEDLAAGTYQFKVVDGEDWKGYSALTEVADYLYFDGSGNVCFRLAEAGDVTVNYKSGELFTVAGNFVAPEMRLVYSTDGWETSTAIDFVTAGDQKTASKTVSMESTNYEFKMVVDDLVWLSKSPAEGEHYVLHRGWRTVDGVNEIDKANMLLQADVAGDYTFTWEYATNTLTVTFPTGDLTLYEDADNTDALTEWDGTSANVTLTRTLKTGMWNTFAAPFSIEIPTGWTVKELTGTSFDAENNRVTMSFGDASSIEAGKPYLVKVNTDDDLQLGVFSAVTVNKTVKAVTTFDYIDFIPTLGKTTIEDDAKNVLFLAAENKLKNPNEIPTDMKGFRAYFLLKGDAANARVFNLDLGEGETTGISTMTKNSVMMNNDVYDLQGRRVQNAAQKGVYIMNGRKVVKK